MTALQLEGMEVDLDADGLGGFDAVIRGGIREDVARTAAYAGLVEMFETEPERHLVFQRQVDADHDGTMSMAELADSVFALLVVGTCAPASCSHGVRDGFESDVDCGTACAACALGGLRGRLGLRERRV